MSDADKRAQQISNRCRSARDAAGLSQGQAAKKLGIARSALVQAEAGNRKISATELADMSRIYGTSVAWLACLDDEPADLDANRIQLAARELALLKREDLDSVIQLVKSIRSKGKRGP